MGERYVDEGKIMKRVMMQLDYRASWWDLERIVSLKINYCCLSFDLVRRDVSLGGLMNLKKRNVGRNVFPSTTNEIESLCRMLVSWRFR